MKLLVFLALCFFAATNALADTAKIVITPGPTCEDGSPVAECPVTHWIVQKQDQFGIWREVGRPLVTQLIWQTTITDIGDHKFRVVAYADGTLAAPSNILTFTVAAPAPKIPGAATISKG